MQETPLRETIKAQLSPHGSQARVESDEERAEGVTPYTSTRDLYREVESRRPHRASITMFNFNSSPVIGMSGLSIPPRLPATTTPVPDDSDDESDERSKNQESERRTPVGGAAGTCTRACRLH